MSADKYRTPAVVESAFFRGSQLTVNLPGRHVPPEVHALAERFAQACEAVRRADAGRTAAETAMRDVENRVMGEAYRAVNENAELDDDAVLGQNEEWALARVAEETAQARFDGAKEALPVHHAKLAAAAASAEWGVYLDKQRAELSTRITEDLARAADTLRELEEIEGLRALVAAGGVSRRRRDDAVAPVEGPEVEQLRSARDLLSAILDTEQTQTGWNATEWSGA
ncbi:hypothetical protein [Micromonospora sp. NPDC048898]|uniref:hypothetical protein n=1 Tax=Micromonospora sp. NPDC048898 TaxID=3364260 RepID=UPI003716820F